MSSRADDEPKKALCSERSTLIIRETVAPEVGPQRKNTTPGTPRAGISSRSWQCCPASAGLRAGVRPPARRCCPPFATGLPRAHAYRTA